MLYNIEVPLNNNSMPTTATNLGFWGWSLSTNLTVQVSPFTLVLEAEALKIDLYVVNEEQNDAHLICVSLLSYKNTIYEMMYSTQSLNLKWLYFPKMHPFILLKIQYNKVC